MTQLSILRQHFRSGRDLTQLEAIGLYRIFRLAARIKELRDLGWDIKSERKTDTTGKAYVRYSMNPPVTMLPERYLGTSAMSFHFE